MIIDSDIKSIGSDIIKSNAQSIVFSKDSQLKTIKKNTFMFSKIKSITIPSSVINIESGAFSYCNTLKKVNFMEPSKICEFEPSLFEYSHIEYLYIPSSIIKLKKFWCRQTQKLINVEISYSNPYYASFNNSFIIGKNEINDDTYDNLVFAPRNIKAVTIPSFILRITSCAFEYCKKITEINFPENSNLRIIGKYSFAFSSIEKITIPSSVVLIDDYSFNGCRKLKHVIINNDSNLKIIGKFAFYNNYSLTSFVIPSSVIKIEENAFLNCYKLEMFEVKEDSQLITFDNDMFEQIRHLVLFAPNRIINLYSM